MDANVSFTGNLGTDVEMKIGEGWRGARFRVAHTPRVMRQGEWVDGTTTWMSVQPWAPAAGRDLGAATAGATTRTPAPSFGGSSTN